MIDDLVGGAIDGAIGAADGARSISEAHTRKQFFHGCLLNLVGALSLIAGVAMGVMYLARGSWWWLAGAIALGVISLACFCYSFYIRQIRPSLEGLE